MFCLVVFTILLVTLIYKIFRNHMHLNNIPKPPCSLFLGHLMNFKDPTKVLQILTNYSIQFGGILRIYVPPAKPTVMITDPEALKIILTSNTELVKAKDYRYFKPWLGNGLVVSDGKTWKSHRRLLAPCFGRVSLLQIFLNTFESFGDVLIGKLEKEVHDHNLNIFPFIKMYSLDIICETSMGVSINAQESINGIYVKSIEKLCQLVISRFIIPYKRFDFMYRFTRDYIKQIELIKIIDNFFYNILKTKKERPASNGRENNKEKQTFLDSLLKINQEDDTFTLKDVRDEVNNFLFGGHDTTATGIAFTLYALSRHPKIQEKVVKEQLSIFGELNKNPPSYEDLQNMKYLELVIYESLRMYPPIPIIGRRINNGINLENGITLPKNLNVAIFIYGCHHNPTYFPEPEKFIPERFEGNNIMPFTFLAFSYGLRNCIGKKYAMLQMKSCISKVIRKFELHPSTPEYTLELVPQMTLFAKNGIRLSLQERTCFS